MRRTLTIAVVGALLGALTPGVIVPAASAHGSTAEQSIDESNATAAQAGHVEGTLGPEDFEAQTGVSVETVAVAIVENADRTGSIRRAQPAAYWNESTAPESQWQGHGHGHHGPHHGPWGGGGKAAPRGTDGYGPGTGHGGVFGGWASGGFNPGGFFGGGTQAPDGHGMGGGR